MKKKDKKESRESKVIGRNSFLSMKRRHPDIFEGENDIA